MHIRTDKQHRDVHRATVEQEVVTRIIAERVAEKLGIALDSASVSHRAYITSTSTSTGYVYRVEVEITDDHTAKPAAGSIDVMTIDGPMVLGPSETK